MVRWTLLLAALLGVLCSSRTSVRAADEPSALAKRVRGILENRCSDCHSDGSAEGEIDFILNRNRLVQRKLVIPRDAGKSKLFRQIRFGDMPKDDDPLAAAEIAAIKRWIDVGAFDWDPPIVREIISPTDVVRLIAKDLDSIERDNPRNLRYVRYFTFTHLFNAGYSDPELKTYRLALNKLVNSLSWGARIVNPEPIDPEKTVFRIDLRNYKWKTDTWTGILAENPYGVVYDTKTAKSCYERTRCDLPYVRGDWFVAKAAIPPLYHDILDIPKTDKALEKRLLIDVALNLRTDQVVRAGFNASGVSSNNRLLERHESTLTRGAYWKSYDFKPLREKQSDGSFKIFPERNLFDHPLGPREVMPAVRKPFQHAGGELIWNLPNGLQAYMLIDQHGNRIDVGPTDIVSDPGRPDRAVINGLSCMSCHARGMKDKDDQILATIINNRGSYTAKEFDLVKALYPTAERFNRLLKEDRKRFTDAVKLTGGKVSDTDPVVVLAKRFEAEVDLLLVAAEVGVTPQDFSASITKFPVELSRSLGALRTAGGTVKREQLVSLFGDLIRELRLGKYLPSISNPFPQGNLIGARAGQAWDRNGLRMKFCWCPPGKFTMGSPKSELNRLPDEDQVEVTLTRGFWLGKYELTQAQWMAVMHTRPWTNQKKRVKEGFFNPATYMSWDDAVAFCAKLTNWERALRRLPAGWEYRLPTEAQWEYACRAGSKTRFCFGDDESQLGDYAWFRKNTLEAGKNYAHRVGTKRPNAWGLHDMHGNVLERCSDWYQQEHPGGTDPKVTKVDSVRVVRNGSWVHQTVICSSAHRHAISPGLKRYHLGFRVAVVQTVAPGKPVATTDGESR